MRVRHYNYNNTVTLNGQPYAVLNGDAGVNRKDGMFINRLTISSVTTRDAGMYICSSTSSSHGFSFRSAFLSILPSGIYKGYTTKTVLNSNNLTFELLQRR